MRSALVPILFTDWQDPATTAWVQRVANEGGFVNPPTRKAVNRFVIGLKSAGLWSSFRRLNLWCGGFAGCRAPLINLSGSATDTLTNFVAADYSDTTGLKTDGTTKYVQTGYTPSEATGDLSVYMRTTQTSDTSGRFLLGASISGGAQQYGIRANKNANNTNTPGNVSGIWGGVNVGSNPVTTGGNLAGFWQMTRRSGTDSQLIFNGASVGTSGTGVTPATAGNALYIFCVNSAGSAIAFSEANTAIAGYSVSSGMTIAQALTYYNIMQTFQTAMGRQV